MRTRTILVALIGVLCAWELLHGWRVFQARRQLLAAQREGLARIEALQEAISEEETRNARLATELQPVQQSRTLAIAQAAGLAGKVAEVASTESWNEPPSQWPSWDLKSPYIWLPVAQLTNLTMSAFQKDGELQPDWVAVLGVEPGEVAALNTSLGALLIEYQREEAARARVLEEHLPGVAERPGRKITVRVEPVADRAAELRTRFEGLVRENLGPRRGEILLGASESWLSEQFPTELRQPRVVSVVREENGTFQLAYESGGSLFSVGGTQVIEGYLPRHLRSLFAPLLGDDAGTGETGAAAVNGR